MNRTILLSFLLTITLFPSCHRDIIYEETFSVNRNGWQIDSVKRFQFSIDDTTRLYDINLLVRNTGDYESQNLWLFVEYVKPDMSYRQDTVQLFLADDYGRWVGSGIGSIYSATYTFRDSLKFDQTGNYILNIQHGMRTDSLKGITDIGLQVKLRN